MMRMLIGLLFGAWNIMYLMKLHLTKSVIANEAPKIDAIVDLPSQPILKMSYASFFN